VEIFQQEHEGDVRFRSLHLSDERILDILNGRARDLRFAEVLEAWQAAYDRKLYLHHLLDWQLGVLQNMMFGQIILGEARVLPNLPATWRPYGAHRP
jgi:hypothetical protein